jgi:hypothetical protein
MPASDVLKAWAACDLTDTVSDPCIHGYAGHHSRLLLAVYNTYTIKDIC